VEVDIASSVHKYGGSDKDTNHALRHQWRAVETDDPAVTMFVVPSTSAEPVAVGVVTDDEGTAIIHAMVASAKFLKGWWKK